MTELKGSQTEQNLLKAFAGESQARNRYTMYAKLAKKEGYEQISDIFLQTAEHERQHAKRFYGHLQGGVVEITAAYPAGPLEGTTAEHLAGAVAGEHEEAYELYPAFAEVAEKEGFKDVATTFRMVAKAEMMHEGRYQRLLDNVQGEAVFKKPATVKWMCRKCGYIHEGPSAPKVCPTCAHPQAYFEVFAENY
jgi:rubrerythrin